MRCARASGEAQANELSVRLELQADCFAGVWAHHAAGGAPVLEQGDIEEALNAAAQIGDDTLQRKSQGTVVPEGSRTASSEQRVSWFKRGLQTGSMQQCNTFEARQPLAPRLSAAGVQSSVPQRAAGAGEHIEPVAAHAVLSGASARAGVHRGSVRRTAAGRRRCPAVPTRISAAGMPTQPITHAVSIVSQTWYSTG